MGRGLSALLSTDSSPADSEEIREIQIDLIRPSEQQPRTSFQEDKLQELAQSIRTSGIIQPLLVRRRGGLFELVAGERRWRAAQLAGLSRIPAIVRDIPDERLLELALIENIQRESEKLTFGHARALLGLSEDVILQRRFAQKIVKHNWSVRETERRIKHAFQENRQKANVSLPSPDPNVRSAEVKLRRYLGTQVRILPAKPGSPGKIEIEYYSDSDLNRIYDALLSKKDDRLGANPAAASATG